MERKPIASRLLKSYAYDRQREILEVEFHSGKIYQYTIPPITFETFEKADSPGSYLLLYIKDKFKCERIEEKDENETQKPLPPAA